MCISQDFGQTSNMLGLFPCANLTNNGTEPYRGMWDLTFNQNVNQEGVLQLYQTNLCVTVMRCQSNGNGFCSPSSNVVAPVSSNGNVGALTGSYLKAIKCYFEPGGNPLYKYVQTFVQQLDCAIGCPPYLQENDVCDAPCDNYACNLDNGNCISAAPTPPTQLPTMSPVIAPSKSPATPAPTRHPSTRHPTPSPVSPQPTPKPTSIPTQMPTSNPSDRPSSSPSHSPSLAPSSSPTSKPSTFPTLRPVSAVPTQSPIKVKVLGNGVPESPPPAINVAMVVAISVPLLLLLFLCCLVFLVARNRRKRAAKDPSNWKSPVNMNKDMYQQWKNQKVPWYHQLTCLIFYTRAPINVNGWAAPGENSDKFSSKQQPTDGKRTKLTGQ